MLDRSLFLKCNVNCSNLIGIGRPKICFYPISAAHTFRGIPVPCWTKSVITWALSPRFGYTSSQVSLLFAGLTVTFTFIIGLKQIWKLLKQEEAACNWRWVFCDGVKCKSPRAAVWPALCNLCYARDYVREPICGFYPTPQRVPFNCNVTEIELQSSSQYFRQHCFDARKYKLLHLLLGEFYCNLIARNRLFSNCLLLCQASVVSTVVSCRCASRERFCLPKSRSRG